MATEAGADVAHGWHVFLLWVCIVLYDTQLVEFFMSFFHDFAKYPVDFFVRAH